MKVLQEGTLTGIFTQLGEYSATSEDATSFALHRMYSVQADLPPVATGCHRLSWSEFEKACGRPRGRAGKEGFAKIPYFFGVAFRRGSWEDKVRQELREIGTHGLEYSDGEGAHEETILVVRTVEEKIMNRELCVFEISRENENVCFEFGLAVAKRKPIRHLFNRAKASVRHPKNLTPFLKGISVEMYSFSDDPSAEEIESLHTAMEKVAVWLEKRRRRIKGNVCSIDGKCRFNPVAIENQVLIVMPEVSLTHRCFGELRRLVQEDIGLQVYPRPTGVQGGHVCHLCKAIGRSKYCIIDTTACDPTYCGALGLAYGFRRKVLNVYEADNPGLITNYAGQEAKEYGDKDQLTYEIRTFLQSGSREDEGYQGAH